MISNKKRKKYYVGGAAQQVSITINDHLDIVLYKKHIYYKDTRIDEEKYTDIISLENHLSDLTGKLYLRWFDTTDLFKIEQGYAKSRNIKGTGMMETEIYLCDRKERFHIIQGYDVSLTSFWYEKNRKFIKKFMKRYYGKDVVK
ncbi:hypothetical protein [Staphylococcus haemolyticus]|uniref:hypothetical protein n=1 Tax=Staphylococcus haemolyticus TaxID=1283 RepID=UPI0034D78209